MNNPRRIQFTNGNVTRYVYTVTGRKLKAVHQTAVPNITVAAGTSHELTAGELLYFDNDWHSLGEKTAVADFIEFDNVPRGALLLLRDHSGGREERVFMYRDNKQHWY